MSEVKLKNVINRINSNEIEFEGLSYSQEKERLLEALSTLEDSIE